MDIRNLAKDIVEIDVDDQFDADEEDFANELMCIEV